MDFNLSRSIRVELMVQLDSLYDSHWCLTTTTTSLTRLLHDIKRIQNLSEFDCDLLKVIQNQM